MSKLDLDELKVQSFVTSLDSKKDKTIKGGGVSVITDHPLCSIGCDDSEAQCLTAKEGCGSQTMAGPAKCHVC